MNSKDRILWIDNLRGFSIVAVVFLHTYLSVGGASGVLFGVPEVINSALYPFRLGLMFFVSGLFVAPGLKKGLPTYYIRKVESIFYPFIVWTILYSCIAVIFATKLNNPRPPLQLLSMHLSGGGDITWFLHTLFIFFTIIIFVKKIPFFIVLPLCWFLYFFLPPIDENSFFESFDNFHFNKSLYLFPFFYLGNMVSECKFDILEFSKNRAVLCASSISCFTVAFFYIFKINFYNEIIIFSILAIPFFVFLSNTSFFNLFNYIGTVSIFFYLSHYLIIQFFAKFIKTNYLFNRDLKFISAFVASLIFCFIVSYFRKINIVKRLFIFG